jgi:glycosyltransferase involved in cell wall biosynthesis
VSAPDVCLISPYPPRGERHGGHSGVASYTANLAHALAGAGADVAVVAPRADGEPELGADGPVRVLRRFGAGAGALPAAAAAAGATGARTVHLQHETFLYGGASSVAGLAPALAALRTRRPTVVTMHHVVDPREVDRAFVRMHRVRAPVPVARAGLAAVRAAIGRLAGAVVVHDPAFADVVPGARVVPHGLEPADADPDAAGWAARWGLDDGALDVLCFGFLAPYKGLEAAVDAAALAGAGVRLVVAGGAHPRMARYADELGARAGRNVVFTGRVADGDVAACFAAADLALFPYPRPVSTSGALALALSHGTPPLVSPELAHSAGLPDALIAPREPAALARRLRALATDRGALSPVRAAAAAVAAGRSWPAVADAHLELYREVSHADRRPGRRLRAAQPG